MQHAILSASGAAQWMSCVAAPFMQKGYKEQSSSFADEGSVAHELAELCLTEEVDPKDHIGNTFEKYPDIKVDVDMADYVQQFMDYVNLLEGTRYVELRVDFSAYVPEGFGTSDIVVVNSKTDTIHIVDLKYGKGVRVEATGNPQLKLYALGTLEEVGFIFDLTPDTKVVMTIHQPRLDHISEEHTTVAELTQWAVEQVQVQAQLATKLYHEEIPVESNHYAPTAKACQWCKAAGTCKALAEHCLSEALEGFSTIEDAEPEFQDYNNLSPTEIGRVLTLLPLLNKWVGAVEKVALERLNKGREITGYKLVEGRTSRKWDNAEEVEKALRKTKLKVSEIFEKKMLTPAKAEKLLGKKHQLMVDHVVKSAGKPTIAPEHDKRKALIVDPTSGFDVIQN